MPGFGGCWHFSCALVQGQSGAWSITKERPYRGGRPRPGTGASQGWRGGQRRGASRACGMPVCRVTIERISLYVNIFRQLGGGGERKHSSCALSLFLTGFTYGFFRGTEEAISQLLLLCFLTPPPPNAPLIYFIVPEQKP